MADDSKNSHSSRSATPQTNFALPIAFWQDELAKGRERIASLRESAGSDGGDDSAEGGSVDELLRTYEELSVAEEELRTQNEELIRAHELAERDRERYHELFERAPVPYIVTDPSGIVREANRAAGTLLGYRPERLIGKPFVVFTKDASRRRFRATLIQMRNAVENVTIGLNIVVRESKLIRVEATGAVGRDSRGTLTEVRWLLIDRTRRRRAERRRRQRTEKLTELVAQRTSELQHAHELKDQLLATVSHEFRTALSAIGGYADLLAMGVRGALSEQQLADIRNIQQAYGHLSHLINDLLDYSRLVAGGGVQMDFTDVRLYDAIRSVRDLVAPQALKREITLRIDAADETAGAVIVRADSERLAQVLLNLLGNAVKFTPPGGRVDVHWTANEADVEIEIVDSGPGIPPDKWDAVFLPFTRLLSSSTPGTGLGLAISRDLARIMGGDISVRDSGKNGSCFVLRLPRSTRLASGAPAG